MPMAARRSAGDRGVGHAGRVLDQGLDAAQALGQREEPRAAQHAVGRLLPARDLGRDHAAEAAHLARGHGVAGMVGQAGVVRRA